jgi:hypothetical protein
MKTLKHFTLAVIAIILMLGSCKKDDENSVPGYFTLDTKKYELVKCYIDKANYADQFFLAFVGNGITFKGFDSSTTGKGPIFFIALKVPEGETGAVSGIYTYQSEPAWAVPFNYNGAMYEEANFDAGDMDNEMEINNDVNLKVTKSGSTFEFSAQGKTEDGLPFVFYYKGEVISL